MTSFILSWIVVIIISIIDGFHCTIYVWESTLCNVRICNTHTCTYFYLLYQKKSSENIENKSSKFKTIGIKVLVTSSNPMKKCQCQTKQLLVPARHWYGLLHPLWDIPPSPSQVVPLVVCKWICCRQSACCCDGAGGSRAFRTHLLAYSLMLCTAWPILAP